MIGIFISERKDLRDFFLFINFLLLFLKKLKGSLFYVLKDWYFYF